MTFREKLERWDPDRCGYRSEQDLIAAAVRLHEEEQQALRERVEELELALRVKDAVSSIADLGIQHAEALRRALAAERDLSRLRDLADRMSEPPPTKDSAIGDITVWSCEREDARREYRAWRDAGKEAKP